MTHLTTQTHSCTGKHCRWSEWDEWTEQVGTFQAGCGDGGGVLGKRTLPWTTLKRRQLTAGRDPQNSSFTSLQIPPEGFDLVHVLRERLIHIKRVGVLTRCVGLGTLLYRSFFGNRRAVFHCLLGLERFKASPSHKLSWSWQMTFSFLWYNHYKTNTAITYTSFSQC